MTFPPNGSGNPSFSDFHHAPKSWQTTNPSFCQVNCPSWMIKPASASPEWTA
jgi:hypothetical protein